MLENNLPALQVVLPLIGAVICALLRSNRLSWFFSASITWLTFAISSSLLIKVMHSGTISYEMGGWKAPYGIEYNVDLLSAFMLVLVSFIASVTIVYAFKSVEQEVEKKKRPLFYSTFMLCMTGLLGMIITNDAFNIYVFLEISSLATYALIAMGQDRRALTSSFEYLVLGSIGATFILIAVGLIYMMVGSLNISDIASRLDAVEHLSPIKAAIAFFTVGIALKVAIFPLHLWLVNSYTNAPSFVSAFLSATATKVGIYVLIRSLFSMFGYELSFEKLPVSDILISLAILAMIIASLVAVFQRNIKRMLAYSSVAQIGYILLGIGIASKAGITSSIIHLFSHALAKGSLFMACGCVLYKAGNVRLLDFRGIAKRMPITTACFLISGLSLIGVPLTSGFISKWYLVNASIESGEWVLVIAIVLSSLLAVAYIWRIIEVAYFQEGADSSNVKVSEAPLFLLAPIIFLTGLTVFFGIYATPVVNLANDISSYLFGLGL